VSHNDLHGGSDFCTVREVTLCGVWHHESSHLLTLYAENVLSALESTSWVF